MAVVPFNHFALTAAALHRELKKTVKEVATSIARDAEVTAPIDTGYLANSIYARGLTWSKFGTTRVSMTPYQSLQHDHFPLVDAPETDLEAVVAVGATYGIYVELGTYKMPAQPYWYQAIDEGAVYLDWRLGLIEGNLVSGSVEASEE